MGQEARCMVRLGGKSSAGKALLESQELVFRGDFRLKIPFKEMKSVKAARGTLRVTFPEGVAFFDLGPQAEKWAARILNPKSLVDKLGVKDTSRVSVVGVGDAAFWKELRARATDIREGKPQPDSDFIFFQADSVAELVQLGRLRRFLKPNGAIWVVTPKGKQHIRENDVFTATKAAGLVDTKVVRFSETHTGLKLVIPLAAR